MELFGWLIFIVVVSLVWGVIQNQRKREMLMKKYNNKELVDRLMKGMFWQGQTSDQLHDSLGRPLDIDQKVLKTKKKEVWKYNSTGKNRYALKITLDNDVVVGWDKK